MGSVGETLKHVIIGTAGHIDHGKSALVYALTGTDPDRLKEEKERGITIDLGFAFLEGPEGLSLGFVDVPGHERFVKNMLAGVGGIDLVMLVVAADESVMPQTREHFEICRLLHVRRGLVVVTKVDLVEPEMRELVALEVKELVSGSFLENAPVLFTSSKTGEGVEALEEQLLRMAAEIESRPATGLLRLPVDRVFSMKGFGTVVTGTLISGSITQDEEIEVLPRGRECRVRGLQVHGQKKVRASAGQRTAVNLQGVEVGDLARGDTLARPGTLAPTLMLDADLEVLASSPVPIRDLARLHVHLGTAQVIGRVRILGGTKAIPPGGHGVVQLRLEAPLVAVPGDRFIIRRYSPLETLGGGRILDAHPEKHRVASAEVVAALETLQSGDVVQAARRFLEEAGIGGLTGAALAQRMGADPGTVERTVETLVGQGGAHRVSAQPLWLVAPSAVEQAQQRLMHALERFLEGNPLREGMSKGELREKVKAPIEVFDWILDTLERSQRIRVARDVVATPKHRIRLTPEEAQARELLLSAYREAGYRPESLSEMASRTRRDLRVLERVQRLLLQEGALVKVAEGMVFHREVLDELKGAISRRKKETDRIDVAFFKELTGVTRKHAIPLLEWLDRERVTRRVGNERVIL